MKPWNDNNHLLAVIACVFAISLVAADILEAQEGLRCSYM